MKIWLKKFTNIYGTLKPIVTVGFEEVAKALGLPDDLTQKMINDFDARITLKDLGNGHVRLINTSKIDPYDITYEWNKEFDLNWRGDIFKARKTIIYLQII